jgi:gluconolactonase
MKRSLTPALALTLAACGSPASTGPTDASVPPTDQGARDAQSSTLDASSDASAATVDAPTEPTNPLGTLNVEMVAENFSFVEGPQWVPADNAFLFTDLAREQIYRVEGSTVTLWAESTSSSNGLGIDAQGRLLRCESGARRVTRQGGGAWTSVASMFDGKPFNSPNDVVVAPSGQIYFTDPTYGLGDAPSDMGFAGVFRVSLDGVVHVEDMRTLSTQQPNGIAASPAGDRLYVTDSARGRVDAYPVQADGSLGASTLVANVEGSDGMAVDTAGNLYVSSTNGIVVLAPDGTPWGTIAIPRQPSNAAFGGADSRTLLVTGQTGYANGTGTIYRVTGLLVPGIL